MGGRNTSSGRTPPPAPMPPPMPVQPPAPKPKPRPKPKPAPTQLDLTKMSDAKLASFVDKAMRIRLPAGFHNDLTQRMILAAKWNEKPEVVPSSQVETDAKKRGAIVLYRTNRTNGYATGQQYSDNFREGGQFSTGGAGGQLYGGGLYFTSSLRGSKCYGDSNRVHPSNTIGAVLNKKARVVSMDDLEGTLGASWLRKHPAAAKAMGFTGGRTPKYSSVSYTSLAMAMGYNVVSNKCRGNEKYYTVLDRSALTTSKKDYYFQSRGMK